MIFENIDVISLIIRFVDVKELESLFFTNKYFKRLINNIPYAILKFKPNVTVEHIYSHNYNNFDVIVATSELLKHNNMDLFDSIRRLLSLYFYPECMELLYSKIPIIQQHYFTICDWGNFDILNHLYDIDIKKDTNIIAPEFVNTSIVNNNLKILEFLIDKGNPIDFECFDLAIQKNHIEILKYLDYIYNQDEYDFATNDLCKYAAEDNSTDCLLYLLNNGYEYDDNVMIQASKNGNLECLEIAFENNCPLSFECTIQAIENGHLECLKYLHDTCGLQMFTVEQIRHVIIHDKLEIFKYYEDYGLKLDSTLFAYVISKQNEDGAIKNYMEDKFITERPHKIIRL